MDLFAKLSLLEPVGVRGGCRIGGLLAILLLTSCAGPSGATDAADPSRVELTSGQVLEVRRILLDTARGVDTGEHIAVLPDVAVGVRWSDVHQAVIDGGKRVGVAVKSTLHADQRDLKFELLTMEGWPGVLQAHRTEQGIVITARIGPYPVTQTSQDRADRLVAATNALLRTLGARPKIEPYSNESPAQAVSAGGSAR